MFDFLKKKGEVPDVGKEEPEPAIEEPEDDFEDEKPLRKKGKAGKKQKSPTYYSGGRSEEISLKLEKADARFEELRDLVKGFNERLGAMNQQIGEVRSMAISNEKSLLKSSQEAARAVEIVGEVKPEKIRGDYQKIDLKVSSVSEKVEENRNILDTLMNEIKDLRRKSGIFVGTDALLKLNEEVKKDLIELQKLGSKVRANADKSEEIFIEIRKNFSSNQKMKETVDNIPSSLGDMKKEIEKIKAAEVNYIKTADLEEFSKKMNDGARENSKKLNLLAETSLEISKKNSAEIESILARLKNGNVADHEDELGPIVKIIDELAGRVNELEKKAGSAPGKISVGYGNRKVMKKHRKSFKNIKVNPRK